MEDIKIDLREISHEDRRYMELIRIMLSYKLGQSDVEHSCSVTRDVVFSSESLMFQSELIICCISTLC
jgi:hypothetical protein